MNETAQKVDRTLVYVVADLPFASEALKQAYEAKGLTPIFFDSATDLLAFMHIDHPIYSHPHSRPYLPDDAEKAYITSRLRRLNGKSEAELPDCTIPGAIVMSGTTWKKRSGEYGVPGSEELLQVFSTSPQRDSELYRYTGQGVGIVTLIPTPSNQSARWGASGYTKKYGGPAAEQLNHGRGFADYIPQIVALTENSMKQAMLGKIGIQQQAGGRGRD